MLPKCGAISRNPRLHAGRHEEHLFVIGILGPHPAVTGGKMLPRRFAAAHGVFTIYKHGNKVESAGYVSGLKGVVGIVATAGCHDARRTPTKSGILQQLPESFAA